MKKSTRAVMVAVSMLVTLFIAVGATPPSPDDIGQRAIVEPPADDGLALSITAPQPMAIGAMRTYGTHLVPPSRTVLDAELFKGGVPLDASPKAIRAARERTRLRFAKQTGLR